MSDFNPLDIEAHDELIEAGQARIKLEDAQIDSDLKWLMADPRGRRLVRMMLEWGGVWRTSFTGDALGNAFHEGERNMACRLLALTLQYAPERVAALMTGEGDQ